MGTDHELLFGVLAVQLHFATPQQVMEAAGAWATDRSRGLARRLQDAGVIDEQRARMLSMMVADAVQAHDDDEGLALATFGGDNAVHQTFHGTIARTGQGEIEVLSPKDAKAAGEDDIFAVTAEHPGRYTYTAGARDRAEIGRGGIGRILVAVDAHLGREVAVKELLPGRQDRRGPRHRHALLHEPGAGRRRPGIPGGIPERSDVWSLGAVLYEVLTGRPPFEDVTAFEVVGKVMTQTVRPVKERCPQAPAELCSITEKALRRDTAGRYANAKEIAGEMEAYTSGERVAAYAYSLWDLLKRFAVRHRAALGVALAAFMALMILGVVAYFEVVEERDRAILAEGIASTERDRAEKSLADAFVERAGSTTSTHEAILLASAALSKQERPDARGLLAALFKKPRPRLRWLSRPGAACYDITYSPDGGSIACASGRRGAIVWDTRSGEERARYRTGGGLVTGVDFSADGKTIAVSTDDGYVRVTQLDSMNDVLVTQAHQTTTSVRFARTGGRMVTAASDGSILLWETGAEKPAMALKRTPTKDAAPAISPDGSKVAVCQGDSILVWMPDDDEKTTLLTGHRG